MIGAVGPDMVVDHIKDDRETLRMGLVDKSSKIIRRAVKVMVRKGRHRRSPS